MENNFLKKLFNKNTEVSENKETKDEEPTEPRLETESDAENNEKLKAEVEKLENNLEGLKDDLAGVDEEQLEKDLKRFPGFAKKLLVNAEKIMFALTVLNVIVVNTIPTEVQDGDIKGLAITLLKLAAASGVISLAWTGFMRIVEKTSPLEDILNETAKMNSKKNESNE